MIVGITGASGSLYGIRLLERLRGLPEVEVHLIVSRSGERTVWLETGKKLVELRSLAHCTYPIGDIGAPPASGSYQTHAMVVAPCSIHTMSAIASGMIALAGD